MYIGGGVGDSGGKYKISQMNIQTIHYAPALKCFRENKAGKKNS
jgi:hypothetical protein